jgi:hypothetical protein
MRTRQQGPFVMTPQQQEQFALPLHQFAQQAASQDQRDLLRIRIVQSLMRGRVVRKWHQLMNQSATKIQTAWRGYYALLSYPSAIQDIMIVQSTVRRWLARNAIEQKRRKRMDLMAMKIQTAWRRYATSQGQVEPLATTGTEKLDMTQETSHSLQPVLVLPRPPAPNNGGRMLPGPQVPPVEYIIPHSLASVSLTPLCNMETPDLDSSLWFTTEIGHFKDNGELISVAGLARMLVERVDIYHHDWLLRICARVLPTLNGRVRLSYGDGHDTIVLPGTDSTSESFKEIGLQLCVMMSSTEAEDTPFLLVPKDTVKDCLETAIMGPLRINVRTVPPWLKTRAPHCENRTIRVWPRQENAFQIL